MATADDLTQYLDFAVSDLDPSVSENIMIEGFISQKLGELIKLLIPILIYLYQELEGDHATEDGVFVADNSVADQSLILSCEGRWLIRFPDGDIKGSMDAWRYFSVGLIFSGLERVLYDAIEKKRAYIVITGKRKELISEIAGAICETASAASAS